MEKQCLHTLYKISAVIQIGYLKQFTNQQGEQV